MHFITFALHLKKFPLSTFSNLGLSNPLIDVLNNLGFTTPTPVQEQAIPLLLSDTPIDFIGLAQTGTGKTAAFGLPLIDLIDSDNRSVQALILAPTRELVQQTAKQVAQFAKGVKGVNVEVVFGGAAITNQISALRKPTQIVIATPGRLIDLIKRKAIKLDQVQYVVLDEADEMLNMGFKEDIDQILSFTPEKRVTWLFSATMPKEIRRIVTKYMKTPVEVSVNSKEQSNKDITHKYVITKSSNKVPAIRRFMDIQSDMRGVLFCRTKRETQQIADDLGHLGYGVEALHGDLSQGQRDAVMKRFKTRSMQLLIATDVAARGIDVNDLTHVMHHTLPDQLESYTHRSGRTGRAGKKGTSIAFITPREGRRISEIEKRINIKFEKIEVPALEELKSTRINNWASLIINTTVDVQAESILNKLNGQFEHLDKDDILKRLITTQLDHLMIQGGGQSDLNEASGSGSGSGRSDKKSGGAFNRYFVNIGTIDGMTKEDLIHFLSDNSKIERKHFGPLSIQKNCAYFDVDAKHDQKLGETFVGIEIKGRDIRVNLDEQARKSKFSAPSKKRNFRDKRSPKKDHRKGRRRN
ncbi:DEAD/DEAH box helicase [Cyclobacteriaceae bacterium]|jgi:ATP-dependent RNA helicase DeaD|nr:DEAD/DEAH box helicase [Cyclobacteriaceae bacterium]|tara:strand:+ start:719 stop:2467 length:1749 start_codon:yes stop_codon:yes gene_type:complete